MNKERKLIIAGNWKMNKTVAEALALVEDLKRELAGVKEVDIVVCPPYTALESVSKAILDSNIRLGAQNMSEHNFGAHTGEIAAVMLKEFSVEDTLALFSKYGWGTFAFQAEAGRVINFNPPVSSSEFIRGLIEGLTELTLRTHSADRDVFVYGINL